MQKDFRNPDPEKTEKGSSLKPSSTFFNFIKHIHPAKVPLNALKYTNTWGLGGMSLVLVFMLMVTGILMLFAYKPVPEAAYVSVQSIINDLMFGQLVRNIHYFSANFLVVAVFCHMLRVFFYTGLFRYPAN